MVDLGRRRVIDLLPDRTSTTLALLDAAVVRRAEQDKEAAQVAALVRGCGAGQPTRPFAPAADLGAWLAEARTCGIGAIETFAAGLEPAKVPSAKLMESRWRVERDGAAMRAALTEPWSSGQAEGQTNRLKLPKRQSYGRASLDLLRRRLLMAA